MDGVVMPAVGRGRGRGARRVVLPPTLAVTRDSDARFQSEDIPDGCALDRFGSPTKTLQEKMGFLTVHDAKQINGSLLPKTNTVEYVKQKQNFMEIPDRLINQNRDVAAAIMHVDVERKEAWVCFYDSETERQRQLLIDSIKKFCGSPEGLQSLVKEGEVLADDEVVIVKDTYGNYRRTQIPNSATNSLASLVDLDGRTATLKFQGSKGRIFRIPPEKKDLHIWFQAVKCKMGLSHSSAAKDWLDHNEFIFKNHKWVETCLLAALECSQCPFNFNVANLQRTENGELTVLMDIFQTQKLMADFLITVKFCTVPRTPSVGEQKLAVITNVRQQGLVDVVMYDSIWMSLRDILKKLYREQGKLSSTNNGFKSNPFFKELIEGFEVRNFLATLPGEKTQLHRVQVLGVEFKTHVKVHCIDIGKEVTIPLDSLVWPFERCTNTLNPQLLELICPQAVTLALKGFCDDSDHDARILHTLRKSLEFKPCLVKIVDASSSRAPPIAVVRTNILPTEVVSIMEYIHSVDNVGGAEVVRDKGVEELKELRMLTKIAEKLGFN